MKAIRFSHRDYDKFLRMEKRPPFTARLLQVFLLQREDIADATPRLEYYKGAQGEEFTIVSGGM